MSNFTALLKAKYKQSVFQNENSGIHWFSEACVKLSLQHSTCENDHKERTIS